MKANKANKASKANKVGQDFNNQGIKHGLCAVDGVSFPRWMPWLFWSCVVAVYVIIATIV